MTEYNNFDKLADIAEKFAFQHFGVCGGEKNGATISGGKLQNISVKHEYIENRTYKTWGEMLNGRCMPLSEAIEHIKKGSGGANRVAVNFAEVDKRVICLDFDAEDGARVELNGKWKDYLKGAVIERSSSGRGLHAFFYVTEEFAERIKGDRERHTGFPFKWANPKDTDGMNVKGIDIFVGNTNRWVKLTGDVEQGSENPELSPEGLAMLEEEFTRIGAFKDTEPTDGGRGTDNPRQPTGADKHTAGVEGRAVEMLGEGFTEAGEVLRLMKANNWLKVGEKSIRGGVCRLMEGDADFIKEHYQGDWSKADYSLTREVTYYTRNTSAIEAVMRSCPLTERGQGYTGQNKRKWQERDDYVNDTIRKALNSRIESGQTYQQKQEQGRGASIPEELQGILDIHPKTGKVMPTASNAATILTHHPVFASCFGYNDISNTPQLVRLPQGYRGRALKVGEFTAEGYQMLQVELERQGFHFNKVTVETAVTAACNENTFNPVKEKLEEYRSAWDGKPRLATMYQDYFNPPPNCYNPEELRVANKMAEVMMLGAVARGTADYDTPVKHDTMLVLCGMGGARKSTAAAIIGKAFGKDYFLETPPRIGGDFDDGKAFRMAMVGKIIVEVPELASTATSSESVDLLKSILTNVEDSFRRPYDRSVQTHPRRSILIGTYNPKGAGFIGDTALARRLHIVQVGTIDTDRLSEDIGQLWGEAYQKYKDGGQNFLTEEDERVALQMTNVYRVQSPLLEVMEKFINDKYAEARKKDCKSVGGKLIPRCSHKEEVFFTLQEAYEAINALTTPVMGFTGKQGYTRNIYPLRLAAETLGCTPHTGRTASGVVGECFKIPDNWGE